MFDNWVGDPTYSTLVRMDREVAVFAAQALPCSVSAPADTLPLWVRAGGLRIEAHMAARQVAWVRRATGGWLAVVLMPAASDNGRLRVTLPLCVDAALVTPDVSIVAPYERPARVPISD
ncbi:MAG: hypothetical protein WAV90_19345 [Gordonia amarae]